MEFDFSRNTSFCITENGADSLHARKDLWLPLMWHKIHDGSFLVNIALLVQLFSETTCFSLL